MSSPNFLPNRTPQELEQDMRDIGKVLDLTTNAMKGITHIARILNRMSMFLSIMAQLGTDLAEPSHAPSVDACIERATAEEQARPQLTVGGKTYEVTDCTMEFDNETDTEEG